MDYNFYKFQKQFSKNLKSHKGILDNKIIESFIYTPKILSTLQNPQGIATSLIFPRTRDIQVVISDLPASKCLASCEGGNHEIYKFDNNFKSEEQTIYCEKKCLSDKKLELERLLHSKTRFFDFTSLRKYPNK